MKIYILTADISVDYDDDLQVRAYSTCVKAQQKLQELAAEYREFANSHGWDIVDDEERVFTAYLDGYACGYHFYLTIHECEIE